jgi:predicted amidohydrolase YtcJ
LTNSRGHHRTRKLADMIVLDQDILGVDPDHIMNIRVMQTWLNGKLVYQQQ